MKKSQLPVCACDQMPGLHHPELGLCHGFGGTNEDGEENTNQPVVFTEEEIEEQKHCKHEESIFDGVCATCGFVDELTYLEAEEISK